MLIWYNVRNLHFIVLLETTEHKIGMEKEWLKSGKNALDLRQ